LMTRNTSRIVSASCGISPAVSASGLMLARLAQRAASAYDSPLDMTTCIRGMPCRSLEPRVLRHSLIIAEAGVNHNGSVDLAAQLVDAAAQAGADVVKFQTFRAETLVSRHAAMARYQKRNLGQDGDQLSMLKRLELSDRAQKDLVELCKKKSIGFLSTPFDIASAHFLVDTLGLDRLKISSGDLANGPLLHVIAKRRIPVILSTGMALLGDVEQALGVLAHGYVAGSEPPSPAAFRAAYLSHEGQQALKANVALLHCTTEYPTAPGDVNLRAMTTLEQAFGLETGYSDHSEGIAVPIAAAAIGASIIEKHFTLDRSMEGPDHKASLAPDELAAMVAGVRVVETALGRAGKLPTPGEELNREAACKSLVAAQDIAAGEVFTVTNLACKRPGNGLSPLQWWTMLGRRADREYSADEVIDP